VGGRFGFARTPTSSTCIGPRRARAGTTSFTVLAFDHRSQFEDLVRETGAEAPRIAAFKALALRAVDFVAAGDKRFACWSMDAMDSRRSLWLPIPILDWPAHRTTEFAPLAFESSADCRNRAGDMAARPGGSMPGFLPSG